MLNLMINVLAQVTPMQIFHIQKGLDVVVQGIVTMDMESRDVTTNSHASVIVIIYVKTMAIVVMTCVMNVQSVGMDTVLSIVIKRKLLRNIYVCYMTYII